MIAKHPFPMQSHTSFEVGTRYSVTEMTVRNWIKRGALGANVRKIGKRSIIRITTIHLEEFERKTGATAYRPEIAPTREDIALGRAAGPVPAVSAYHKKANALAVRKVFGGA